MKTNKNVPSFLIFTLLLLLMSSCENIAKFTEVATVEEANPRTEISFSGINSVSGISATTATLNWIHVSGASAYQIFSVNGSVLAYLDSVNSPISTYTLTSLTPGATTTYVVRLIDTTLLADTNTNYVSLTTLIIPQAPSGLSLSSPAYSTSTLATPVITVNGVSNGDDIKLFSDNTCTTEVGSATSSGTTVNITITALSAGSYSFYANSTRGGTSTCSTASVDYRYIDCPSNYILVPGNTHIGIDNYFCVMKYEAKAKNVSTGNMDPSEATANWGHTDHIPASHPDGVPWTEISQTFAFSECRTLNSEVNDTNINNDANSDGTYSLISNQEWMAIARNVENVDSNWTNGIVGTGLLFRGHTDNVPSSVLSASSDDFIGYLGTENAANSEQRRTLTLSNSEVIWDLAGNVWEWIDWDSINDHFLTPSPKGCTDSEDSAGYNAFDEERSNCNPAITNDDFGPSRLYDNHAGNSYYGLGQWFGGSGGAALRGGSWYHDSYAGVFALFLNNSSTSSDTNIGFRCSFRVPSP